MNKFKYIVFAFLITFVLGITGCTSEPTVPEYVYSECPIFDAELIILIEEYNETHALISWNDADKIEYFLDQKAEYNYQVNILNIEAEQMKNKLMKEK